eukprot:CAMPEP_0114588078 /NCGR_PEP_ID=MMETSP0125-20121206/10878_1 /TAXON_ID=485358 ORGANISM="Aristerostoma sp., Strain ATCC 50986" /NCGR_SAMPLE_ID=MMETSP0125 /ASSEMBLY_ACC=CAM_ASM_000245 /LENGTH=36 /DNA_ID= /DNA_START= /DNA_END= /DNA_ORIENTATION=
MGLMALMILVETKEDQESTVAGEEDIEDVFLCFKLI